MIANQTIEIARADKKHGSCGFGIWETIKRYKYGPHMNFKEFCLSSEVDQISFLNKVKKYYEPVLKILPEWQQTWDNENTIKHFITDCANMFNVIRFTEDDILVCYDNIIMENGQGLLLNDPGYDAKGKTPSKTGLDYAIKIIENYYPIGFDTNVNVHYVTRPYLTRHGADDSFKEKERQEISSGIEEDMFNLYNEPQGKFKYGTLNLELLEQRINADFNKGKSNWNKIINITHCDEMDRTSEFKDRFSNIITIDSPKIII